MDQEPVNNVEVYEKEEEEVEVVELDERSADSLLWISSAANILSWIVLVAFAGIVGITVYGNIDAGLRLTLDLQSVYTVLNWVMLLSVGVSLFVILQAVAKGAMVLLGIHDRDLA
jgi:hypothetical protein